MQCCCKMSVCLYVWQSHSCILSKRLNISSDFFHHSSFFIPNGMTVFQQGSPRTGSSDARGMKNHDIPLISRFISALIHYLQLPTNRKSYMFYRMAPFSMTHFQWPWTIPNQDFKTIPNQDFKVMPLFNAEKWYLRNGMRYMHSYMKY